MRAAAEEGEAAAQRGRSAGPGPALRLGAPTAPHPCSSEDRGGGGGGSGGGRGEGGSAGSARGGAAAAEVRELVHRGPARGRGGRRWGPMGALGDGP